MGPLQPAVVCVLFPLLAAIFHHQPAAGWCFMSFFLLGDMSERTWYLCSLGASFPCIMGTSECFVSFPHGFNALLKKCWCMRLRAFNFEISDLRSVFPVVEMKSCLNPKNPAKRTVNIDRSLLTVNFNVTEILHRTS